MWLKICYIWIVVGRSAPRIRGCRVGIMTLARLSGTEPFREVVLRHRSCTDGRARLARLSYSANRTLSNGPVSYRCAAEGN